MADELENDEVNEDLDLINDSDASLAISNEDKNLEEVNEEANNEDANLLDLSDDQFSEFMAKNLNFDETITTNIKDNENKDEVNNLDALSVLEIDDDTKNKIDVNTDVIDTIKEKDKSTKSDKPTDKVKDEAFNTDNTIIDYKSEHDRLLKTFRANGRDIKVNNVDEAIKLMQMGANYNKKMEGLKPSLKIVKMLENNDLLDETKLNYLIDLDKKNPDAITKLLKDSKIDPVNIDTSTEIEYKPNTYNVNDNEVNLDLALRDIQDTPTFKETVDIISNKWDESSKQDIINNPTLIKIINEHVDTGIYKKINDTIENRRMLGGLLNISDLEAYRIVGEELQKSGSFEQKPVVDSEALAAINTSTTNKIKDSQLKDKKKAAKNTTKATKIQTRKPEYNPLTMSDEEFEKVSSSVIFS